MAFSKGVSWASNGLDGVIPYPQAVMIQSLNGASSLKLLHRHHKLATIFILAFVLLSLSSCGAVTNNQNWPGLTSQGDQLYLAYGSGVAAFNADSGQQLWQFPAEPRSNWLFYAPPVADNDQVYLGDYGVTGGFFSPGVTVSVFGLDANGNSLSNSEDGSLNNELTDRIVAGLAINDNTLFVGTNDNYLVAFDRTNGSEKWRFETGNSIYAKPILADETLYIASLDQKVYALNAETGVELWSRQVGGSIMNAPMIDSDSVYVNSFNNSVHKLARADGGESWVFITKAVLWAGVAVRNDIVLTGDLEGTIYGIDAGNGAELWSIDTEFGSVQATPLIDQNRGLAIFVFGDLNADDGANAGTILALDAGSGEEKWQQKTSGTIFSQPVLVNGNTLAVAPTEPTNPIYLYDIETGAQKSAPLTPRSE